MRKSEIALYVLIFLVGIVAVLTFRQVTSYKGATEAFWNGNYIQAVDGFCEVLYNHIPFSPLEKNAINYLYRVIKMADEKGDETLKLYAIEMLRRSIYGTRHLLTPHISTLHDLNREVIKLRSQLLIKDGYLKSLSETEEEMKSIVETELAPNPLLAFVTICFFLGYVVFGFWNIFRSTRDDYLLTRKFLLGILILALLALSWSIGFYLC